jgi:hypothetical protein
MPRYYFHFENGEILHDDTGVELPELPPPRTKLCEELAILCGGGSAYCQLLGWDTLANVGD